MILYVKGNLFQSPAQVLVNTVNTVGVMGKGIALEFKRLFPEMYCQYRNLCEQKRFEIGKLWLYKSPNKWVLNFPTKQDWRSPSRIEYIEAGLNRFVETYAALGIHSIAFPPLGCGNGQLHFDTQVKPLMESYLRHLPIDIFIYPGKPREFVEHLHPDAMKRWLQTEPTLLPFAEVWDDLLRVLKTTSSFETRGHQTSFTAQIVQQPPHIVILADGQTYTIEYEMLLAFWQQLRTHGFSMSAIVPGLANVMPYLTAIFTKLDYIQAVQLSKNYAHGSAESTGLQVLPSAFSREKFSAPLPQLTLF